MLMKYLNHEHMLQEIQLQHIGFLKFILGLMTKGQCQSSWSQREYFLTSHLIFRSFNLKQVFSWLEMVIKIYTAVIYGKQFSAFVEAKFAYVRY